MKSDVELLLDKTAAKIGDFWLGLLTFVCGCFLMLMPTVPHMALAQAAGSIFGIFIGGVFVIGNLPFKKPSNGK